MTPKERKAAKRISRKSSYDRWFADPDPIKARRPPHKKKSKPLKSFNIHESLRYGVVEKSLDETFPSSSEYPYLFNQLSAINREKYRRNDGQKGT